MTEDLGHGGVVEVRHRHPRQSRPAPAAIRVASAAATAAVCFAVSILHTPFADFTQCLTSQPAFMQTL